MTCIRIYRSIYLAIVLVVALMASKSTQTLTPQLIKNTALLEAKPKLPAWLTYGVLFGMVFIETHIAENYTRYAPEKTATSKLLQELFNIKTGEFRIPDPQISIAGNYINLETMGKIIRMIFELGQDKKDLFLEKFNTTIKPEVKKDFKKTLQKLEKKYSKKSFRSSFKKFAESLTGSLEECNYWGDNKTPLYAPHTTLYLLYGFIYKKALDRADLKRFFDTLCKNNKSLGLLTNTNPALEKNWLADSYDLKNLATKKIETQKTIDIEKLLVTGLVQNWLECNMPPMIDYGSVSSKKYPAVAVCSDCVRTAIRSIGNILAFDPDTQLFSTKMLLKNAPGARKELQQFYSTYPGKKLEGGTIIPYTAAELQDDELRTIWSDDVIKTNIPYATYVELYTKAGVRVKVAPKITGPFAICLPDNSSLLKNKNPNTDGFYEHVVTIGDISYDAFTPSSGLLGFGFAPYTHTLIFALDHLLGLKLFNGAKIDEELVKPDFEKIYMEKLSHISPFKKIVSEIAHSTGTHDVTTNRGQTFYIGLQNGLHAYVKSIGIARSSDNIWKEIKNKNGTIDPEIMLFLAHTLNVDPGLADIANQSYFFRGDWFLNRAKLTAIKKITDHLNLKTIAKNSEDPEEYLKDIFIYTEDDTPHDQVFYFQVIKNILDTLNFVIGEIDLCGTIMDQLKDFFLHNAELKEIVLNDLQNKLLKQRTDNGDNVLMIAVKSGSPEEVDRVLDFIKTLKKPKLTRLLLEQTNKNQEDILMVAKKLGNKKITEKISAILEG